MITVGSILEVTKGCRKLNIPIRATLNVLAIGAPADGSGITDVTVSYNKKPRTFTVRSANRLADEWVTLRAFRVENQIVVRAVTPAAVVTHSGAVTLPAKAAEMGLTLRTLTIRCAHCLSRHEHTVFHSLGAMEAQESARLAGYKYNCDGWVCPGCVKKGWA